jgi:hypothetical protein
MITDGRHLLIEISDSFSLDDQMLEFLSYLEALGELFRAFDREVTHRQSRTPDLIRLEIVYVSYLNLISISCNKCICFSISKVVQKVSMDEKFNTSVTHRVR